MVSSSLTEFRQADEIWRIILAYLGYITPSVLLVSLFAFYDPKTSLCHEFDSVFLLDNTRPPILNSLSSKEEIVEEFQTFRNELFSYNYFDQKDYLSDFSDHNENSNNNDYLHTSEVEDLLSLKDHLESMSFANKYFLMKTLGDEVNKRWEGRSLFSRNNIHLILGCFTSADVIENFLSLLREFGVLHFCSDISKLRSTFESEQNLLSDTLQRTDYVYSWWRGYSPYDVDYKENFEVLLDALLLFEEDIRFSDHLVCFSKIFGIDKNLLYRDFSHMKDLKAKKTSVIVRRGENLNGTFSVHTHGNPNHSSRTEVVLKVFGSVVHSLYPKLSCDNLPRKEIFMENFYKELFLKTDKILEEEFGPNIDSDNYNSTLLYLASDFNKSSLKAELKCGDISCFDMSLTESKICKPFVKPTKKLNHAVLVLLIINGLSICWMVCFDVILVNLPRNGHGTPKKPLSTFVFVVLFASPILYLSSRSFKKSDFCALNIKEPICQKQRNYRHEGALHTIEDPLYISAPEVIFPPGYGHEGDILDINQTVSPCTLELRTRFFIEIFQMSATVNPNDFVLLNGETLKFAPYIDFHSRSKEGFAMFGPIFFVNAVNHQEC